MSRKSEQKYLTESINTPIKADDSPESYRKGMPIEEVMVFDTWFGKTGYYVCPRCKVSMDREFVSFCGHCGQKLDWKHYKKAKPVYPGKRNQ